MLGGRWRGGGGQIENRILKEKADVYDLGTDVERDVDFTGS